MEIDGSFALGLAARFEVDIMDQIQPHNLDAEDERFYPVPHSHWFPRPIAFRAYKSSGARLQQDGGLKGARRLHIQVSRPVSLTLTLNPRHCFVSTNKDIVL